MSIKDLKKVENEWSWRIEEIEYRTDKSGDGVWVWTSTGNTLMPECKPEMAWKQIRGTCDFTLWGYSPSGARKKLNRVFCDNEMAL